MARYAKSEIRQLIFELRKQLELTQEELAAQLGVTFASVNRWENGHTHPSRLALLQIKALSQKMGEGGQDLWIRYLSDSKEK